MASHFDIELENNQEGIHSLLSKLRPEWKKEDIEIQASYTLNQY